MRTLGKLLLLSLVLFSAGCSTIAVKHEYDTKANLSSLKTFGWMERPKATEGPLYGGATEVTLLERRIEKAIKEELGTKGIEQGASHPDFLRNLIPK